MFLFQKNLQKMSHLSKKSVFCIQSTLHATYFPWFIVKTVLFFVVFPFVFVKSYLSAPFYAFWYKSSFCHSFPHFYSYRYCRVSMYLFLTSHFVNFCTISNYDPSFPGQLCIHFSLIFRPSELFNRSATAHFFVKK